MPFLAIESGTASSPKYEWPAAVVAPGEDADLVKLRYAEQLKEVAAQRQTTRGRLTARDLALLAIATGAGIFIVAVGTVLSRSKEPTPKPESRTQADGSERRPT